MTTRRTVLVTGAGSGFGRLIALTLARRGHAVYATMHELAGANSQQAAAIAEIAAAEKLDLSLAELDVTSEQSCRAAVDLALAQTGRLDIVVNNAGILMTGLTESFRPEQVLQILNVNAVGWLRVNRAALPVMRRQREGLIVYVSSGITRMIDPFLGPYAASKAAADALAESMHYENSRYGIDSVILQPGAYPSGTSLFTGAVPPADSAIAAQYDLVRGMPERLGEWLGTNVPPGEASDPGRVAEAVVHLIEMAPGTRPLRLVLDPFERGVDQINALATTLQRKAFRTMGIEDLMAVREREG